MLPICFDPGRNHRCPNGRRRSFTPSPGVPDSAAQHGGNPIELPWRRPVWSAIAPGRPQAPRVGVSTHRRLAMAGRCRSPISRSGSGGFANLARQKQPPRALHRTTRSFFDPTLDSSHVTSTSDKPSLRLMKALPQDLGGVSASAIDRQHTEPDVPADLSELFGESVSDRRTTDYSSACFCD